MRYLPGLATPADLKRLPPSALPEVAAEIRSAIIEQVSKTGGHLAPNLGVVELTIALHYVFDFGHDRLLFDVGHQCYPHKLLTGRYPLLPKLRTREGMAGFPEPSESPYDLFSVGHAGTGISTAVGMARGDTLNREAYDARTNPEGRRVVTLIGDASIANGVAMEGLNNAGTLKRQFLVVLNDNGMSIAKPQGALAQYFDRVRLSHTYADFKRSAAKILGSLPGGSLLRDAYHRTGEATKAMVSENTWFEHFGLVTVGPIDGHNLTELIEFLSEAREFEHPMVLHVKTVKGKGLDFAESDSTKFHSPSPFTMDRDETLGCRVEVKSEGRSFTAAFGEAMEKLIERDERVVACTAAMPDGTGLTRALKRFPERVWDTGICESHALDMMAGLAKTGQRPFLAVYGTFFQRAFDQAFQEAALQGLPVRLCLDRAGLVGGDGAVHHGFCDTALLRTLPEAVVMAAMDEPSLLAALEFMRTWDESLSSVRYPRDSVSELFANETCPAFELGRARSLTPEVDVERGAVDAVVLAFGTVAISAARAAGELREEYRVAVYDARFAKPVDEELIRAALSRGIPVLTIEEHSPIGGFGSAVLESASEMGLDASRVVRLAMPDAWVRQDGRSQQLAETGLDTAGIKRAIRALIEDRGSGTRPARSVEAKSPEAGAARDALPR